MSAKIINRTCDCGNPAVKKDGSGWSCQRCIDSNHAVSHMLERVIEQQRREDPELFDERVEREKAQIKAYNERNYQKLREYHRNYNKRYARA